MIDAMKHLWCRVVNGQHYFEKYGEIKRNGATCDLKMCASCLKVVVHHKIN